MRNSRFLLLALSCFLSGCCDCFNSASTSAVASNEAAVAADPEKSIDASPVVAVAKADAWGTVRGQIVFGGSQIPERKPLDIQGKDPQHCLSKGPLLNEQWMVNPANKGVKWVMAAMKPATGKKLEVHPSLQAISPTEVILDQPVCAYEPRLLGVRIGQTLVAKNPAPVPHNVLLTGFRNQENQTIPAEGSHKFTLRMENNAVKVACGMHPWMTGYLWTFDHPYYAVTDADGKFEIKLAPIGNCHLMLWHETGFVTGGKQGMPIEVKPGEVTDLGKIELKPKE